ncbi:hypothetical protein ED733_002978 [Metarhizium rileyi]|uniref:Uncharacterized protein n=1 Tax=Metarhizium rileyi (strain RCEF 4871) TaxID=1649241 RepID=A0A5C6GA75_METRR|nr:hypothetical protein ED733_002978 [Metarhizium rileyi]
MSPDTVSSLFPDRPIRPLPRRRLRERLSPEAADSIKYPLPSGENTQLFHYPPYTVREESSQLASVHSDQIRSVRSDDSKNACTLQRYELQSVGGGEEVYIRARSISATKSPAKVFNTSGRQAAPQEQSRQAQSQQPPSATSSLDGYDSLENTNNKKKRKIPSAAESSINGAHGLGSEINGLGLSPTTPFQVDEDHSAERSYGGSNNYPASSSSTLSNQGFSGPGRGRLVRSANGRTPLRALPDGNSTWTSRAAKAGTTSWSAGNDSGGIISSAIANAGMLPPQGQENVSLLQQHSFTPKSAPASAQFTFTCDAQVSGTVQWPGNASRDTMATHGFGIQSNANINSSTNNDIPQAATNRPQSQKQTRRQLDRELRMAARHRRQTAAETFYQHPPKTEDMWICEFCEYERIFGEAPKALIRSFEIKDRRQRREEAERKRLLEKAKAKSRKSRKSNKILNKGEPSENHHPDHVSSDSIDGHKPSPMRPEHSHSVEPDRGYDGRLALFCAQPEQGGTVHQEGDGGGTGLLFQAKS